MLPALHSLKSSPKAIEAKAKAKPFVRKHVLKLLESDSEKDNIPPKPIETTRTTSTPAPSVSTLSDGALVDLLNNLNLSTPINLPPDAELVQATQLQSPNASALPSPLDMPNPWADQTPQDIYSLTMQMSLRAPRTEGHEVPASFAPPPSRMTPPFSSISAPPIPNHPIPPVTPTEEHEVSSSFKPPSDLNSTMTDPFSSISASPMPAHSRLPVTPEKPQVLNVSHY